MPFTHEEAEKCEMEHLFGGNGYAVLDDLGDDYCRLVVLTKDGIGTAVYMAWKKITTVAMRDIVDSKTLKKVGEHKAELTEDQVEKLREVQSKVANGELIVKNQRLVANKL